ncbi:hypothetical protein VTK26DRAFT_8577 [Humicola hyalothermophila]
MVRSHPCKNVAIHQLAVHRRHLLREVDFQFTVKANHGIPAQFHLTRRQANHGAHVKRGGEDLFLILIALQQVSSDFLAIDVWCRLAYPCLRAAPPSHCSKSCGAIERTAAALLGEEEPSPPFHCAPYRRAGTSPLYPQLLHRRTILVCPLHCIASVDTYMAR